MTAGTIRNVVLPSYITKYETIPDSTTVEAFRELQAKYTALQAQHVAFEARMKQLEAQVRA